LVAPAATDNGFEEWLEARHTIGRFDDNLHDLRKYGFSFITALLTADAILTGPGSTTFPTAPGYLKLSILLVTLGLYVSLRQLDQHYRLFQQAASRRAIILERRLNVELTEEITHYYGLSTPEIHWWLNVHRFYVGFLLLTTGLGLAILYNGTDILSSSVEMRTLILGAGVTYLLMRNIVRQGLPRAEDWSIDKKVINQKETIRIAWTNIGKEQNRKGKGGCQISKELKWEVSFLATGKNVKTDRAQISVDLSKNSEHDWLWETTDEPEGLYEFKGYDVNKPADAVKFIIQVVAT